MKEEDQLNKIKERKENPRLKRKPLNLGSSFINYQQQRSTISVSSVLTEYNVLLLLFGAGSCNVTKPFIGSLKKHYEQINLEKKNLEIIFVSLDKNKEEYDKVTQDMPWLGIPMNDERVKDLKQFYNVRGIPELVLVSNEGEIVCKNCRKDIYELGEDEAFQKWTNKKANMN